MISARTTRLAHALLLLLAAVVAFGVTLEIHRSPFGAFPILDEEMYIQWAKAIAGGAWIGKEAFFFDPLQAYFLAVVFRLTGDSLLAARLVQAALGVLTIEIAFRLGRRLFGWREGFLAAGLLALYGPFYFHFAFLLKEGLVLLLTTCCCYFAVTALDSTRWRSWIATGGGLGLLALLRGNFLLLIPAVIAWPFWALRHRERREQFLRAGMIALGVGVPVALSTAHNLAASGELVLTTSHGGPNFYIGNNPGSTGDYRNPPFVRAGPKWEEIDFQREAERRTGHSMSRREVSSYWLSEGLRFWREQPLSAFRLFFLKAWLVFHSYEIPDNYSFSCIRSYFAPTLWIAFLSFGFLIGPALVAAFLSAREDPRAVFPAVFGGLYALTVVAFFVFDRYRVPLIPLLALFSARFTTLKFDWLRQHRRPALLASGTTMAAISIATFIPSPVSRQIDRHEARCLHIAGMSLADEGQFAPAVPLLARSAALAPLENESFYNLGVAYQGAEQFPQAREAYQRALTLDQARLQASYNLALILLRQGDSAGAIPLLNQARQGGLHTAGVMGALGQALARQTNFASAAGAYEEALALDPGDSRIRRGLVDCLAQSGQCDRAWEMANRDRAQELTAALVARCPKNQP